MRRFIQNHLLLCAILSLLTPGLTLVSAAAYYVIGVLEFHYLYFTRGGIAAMLTLVCFAVLNLLFISLDLCCCYYAARNLKVKKSTRYICCLIFSLFGLLGCIILWGFTFTH